MRASGDVIVAETATICTIAKRNGRESTGALRGMLLAGGA